MATPSITGLPAIPSLSDIETGLGAGGAVLEGLTGLPGLGAIGGAAGAALGTASQNAKSLSSWLSPPRIAAFVIGIVAIGAGVMMFKQTQVVIQAAGRTAAKGAAIAAL